MSLATDILKRAGIDISPPPRQRNREVAFIKMVGRVSTGYKGVVVDKRHKTYRARGPDKIALGSFSTPERADIANRLYNFWLSRGYCEPPTGCHCGYIDYQRYTD